MATLNALRQRRSTIVDGMRALTTLASNESRDLSEQEDTEFKELRTKLGTLDKDIERTEIIDTAERSVPFLNKSVGDGTEQDLYRSVSLFKAINGQLDKSVDDGREREASQHLAEARGKPPSGRYIPHEALLTREQRTTVLSTGTGSGLIPTDHRGDLIIQPLTEGTTVAKLGATVYTFTHKTELPRVDVGATGTWIAEDSDLSETAIDINSLEVDGTDVGAVLPMSRKQVQQNDPSTEDEAILLFQSMMGDAINSAAIAGSGVGPIPLGILNDPNVTTISHGTNGGPPTWASALSFISSMANDKALNGKLGWLTNPDVVGFLRQTVRVATTDSRMIMDNATSLADYPLAQSTHAPNTLTKGTGTNLSAAIFGNWQDLILAMFSGVDILVNPYGSQFIKGGLSISAIQTVDVKIRHPESFAIAVDLDLS